MKLASFLLNGAPSYGTADETGVRAASPDFMKRFPDVASVLARGAIGEMEQALGDPVPLGGVEMLPPIPEPGKIICIGQNYLGHILEMGREPPDHPAIFTRYPASIRGHGQNLIRPRASASFDFEGELGVVIGRECRAVSEDDALDHVAGYTCFMDGSIRDFQRHTTQFWPGKNFTGTGAMGPWIVTRDAIGLPQDLYLRTRLNGEEVQSSPVSDLAFPVPTIIAYISQVTELLPGDVIATGTPSGVGAARKPPLFMKAGDRLEVEITGIGTLANPVVDET